MMVIENPHIHFSVLSVMSYTRYKYQKKFNENPENNFI